MEEHLQLTLDSGAVLGVRRFSIHESLSDLFEVNLFCRSDDANIDLEAIVNQPARFRLESPSVHLTERVRVWTGVAATAELVRADRTVGANKLLCSYYVKVVPELWRLKHKVNHRIFQRKTIPEIVKVILDEEGIKSSEDYGRLGKTYFKYDYIVQYGESDYDFVLRLLEREGITYLFRHKGESDTELLLSDHPHDAAARPPLLYADSPNLQAQQEVLTELRIAHRVAPGTHVVRDFDFRRNTDFAFVGNGVHAPSAPAVPKAENFYEQYHYIPGDTLRIDAPGGDTRETKRADDMGKVRSGLDLATEQATIGLEADRRRKRTVSFRTNVPDLAPGKVMSCSNAPRDDLGEDVLITDFTLEGAHDDQWEYEGEGVFTCQPYSPDSVTPKPRIHGLQSAVVVGPDGQDVWCDEFGRVRVQFQWDREGKLKENSSCWVRVSYAWAGAGFGHITIPRVGQEVLVAFLEGDPDLPVVVGRVYNQIEPIPSESSFPRYATRSTWMSDTAKDKDGAKFNEIRMEDAKDGEFIYVQAQLDLQQLVRHDETERTGANHATVVGNDRRVIVGKSDTTMVGAKYSVQMTKPPSKEDLRIVTNQKPVVEPLATKLEMVNKKIFITSGKTTAEMEKKDIIFEAKKEISLKAGGTIVVEGGPKIKINCGTAGNSATGGTNVGALKESGMLSALPDQVAELTAKSPTLTRQLLELQAKGWTIATGPAGGGSFADRDTKTITVESGQGTAGTVQTLGHEAGHAEYGQPPYVAHDGLSRQEYVDANVNEALKDEGQAQFNSAKVRGEIISNGGEDVGIPGGGDYQTPYDQFEAGTITQEQAIDQMANEMGNETTSTTGENYRAYYGQPYEDHWDNNIAPGGTP